MRRSFTWRCRVYMIRERKQPQPAKGTRMPPSSTATTKNRERYANVAIRDFRCWKETKSYHQMTTRYHYRLTPARAKRTAKPPFLSPLFPFRKRANL